MDKDDNVYLKHILGSIASIEEYSGSLTKQQFLQKSIVQDAVIRQIEIIGEAAKLLSQKTKNTNPSIPWKDIAGMRDKLIHGYFGVDLEAVWKTVKKDIQILISKGVINENKEA